MFLLIFCFFFLFTFLMQILDSLVAKSYSFCVGSSYIKISSCMYRGCLINKVTFPEAFSSNVYSCDFFKKMVMVFFFYVPEDCWHNLSYWLLHPSFSFPRQLVYFYLMDRLFISGLLWQTPVLAYYKNFSWLKEALSRI